jgi:hypothetical protein
MTTGSPSNSWRLRLGFADHRRHCIVTRLEIQDRRRLLPAPFRVGLLVMLVDVVGVVPKANRRPPAVFNDLQRDRVGDRRRRLAAPEADAPAQLQVDEHFSLAAHRASLSKWRGSRDSEQTTSSFLLFKISIV